MNLAVWVVSGILAAVALAAGATKAFVPTAKLAKESGWEFVLDFSRGLIKALGLLEILGAAGLILPALLDIAPFLTPLAAIGLGLIMPGAVYVRLRRREYRQLLVPISCFVGFVFLVLGRFLWM